MKLIGQPVVIEEEKVCRKDKVKLSVGKRCLWKIRTDVSLAVFRVVTQEA